MLKQILCILLGSFIFQIHAFQNYAGKPSGQPIEKLKPNLKPKLERFLLITGCARSGTTYIVNFLQKSGVRINHELLGEDGCCSWFMAVDTFKGPWKFPGALGITFNHIFHQVRHPLDVISSVFTTEPIQSWKYICSNIPEITMEESKITRCAKYWYYWNLAAEKKAEWTYKIEDLNQHLDEMSIRLGFSLSREILKTIPKNTNTRGPVHHKFTWLELKGLLEPDLFYKIQEMACRYGYSLE